MQTASHALSAIAALDYRISGLPALPRLRGLVQEVQQDDGAARLLARLRDMHEKVLASPRQFLLIAEAERLPALTAALHETWRHTPMAAAGAVATGRLTGTIDPSPRRTAWLINSQVQFCAAAYPAVPVDHPDAPAFMVLGGFLRNGFLHRAIREQGGAYGGGAGYDGNACAFRFFSYRDPRLEATFADFQASLDWLRENPHEDRQLEEAILGIIASLDKPLSPAGEARSAFHNALYGRTPAQRRKMRAALLAVSIADLQRVAATYLRPDVMSLGVVAPHAQAAVLEGLGFSLQKL